MVLLLGRLLLGALAVTAATGVTIQQGVNNSAVMKLKTDLLTCDGLSVWIEGILYDAQDAHCLDAQESAAKFEGLLDCWHDFYAHTHSLEGCRTLVAAAASKAPSSAASAAPSAAPSSAPSNGAAADHAPPCTAGEAPCGYKWDPVTHTASAPTVCCSAKEVCVTDSILVRGVTRCAARPTCARPCGFSRFTDDTGPRGAPADYYAEFTLPATCCGGDEWCYMGDDSQAVCVAPIVCPNPADEPCGAHACVSSTSTHSLMPLQDFFYELVVYGNPDNSCCEPPRQCIGGGGQGCGGSQCY
ncbi:hypothetical protein JKP88DRAFT_261426 [Tribonema minus]|uniref:Uncharacterized protein n=1 Tax=Tribonema minus TaxID=303371 RepID=A0A835YUM1_9STRA|nr:hypothetical protein JKP88DRAFT_261426 [Tribonema minus]